MIKKANQFGATLVSNGFNQMGMVDYGTHFGGNLNGIFDDIGDWAEDIYKENILEPARSEIDDAKYYIKDQAMAIDPSGKLWNSMDSAFDEGFTKAYAQGQDALDAFMAEQANKVLSDPATQNTAIDASIDKLKVAYKHANALRAQGQYMQMLKDHPIAIGVPVAIGSLGAWVFIGKPLLNMLIGGIGRKKAIA